MNQSQMCMGFSLWVTDLHSWTQIVQEEQSGHGGHIQDWGDSKGISRHARWKSPHFSLICLLLTYFRNASPSWVRIYDPSFVAHEVIPRTLKDHFLQELLCAVISWSMAIVALNITSKVLKKEYNTTAHLLKLQPLGFIEYKWPNIQMLSLF